MRRLILAVLLAAPACAAVPPAGPAPEQLERVVPGSPAAAVRAGSRAFATFLIPVQSSDPESGTLQSGQVTLSGSWGGVPLGERIDCGRDELGTRRVSESDVTLSVAMIATPRGSEGTAVRIVASGTGGVRVAGTSKSRSEQAVATERFPCTLTPAFAEALLHTIASSVVG
jgi:hypothetical protein